MLTDDAMSNPSYEALSNDEGTAGSCYAAVQQTLAKIPWKTCSYRQGNNDGSSCGSLELIR